MAAILDFCTKMKNSYVLALNDLLDQSQPAKLVDYIY